MISMLFFFLFSLKIFVFHLICKYNFFIGISKVKNYKLESIRQLSDITVNLTRIFIITLIMRKMFIISKFVLISIVCLLYAEAPETKQGSKATRKLTAAPQTPKISMQSPQDREGGQTITLGDAGTGVKFKSGLVENNPRLVRLQTKYFFLKYLAQNVNYSLTIRESLIKNNAQKMHNFAPKKTILNLV